MAIEFRLWIRHPEGEPDLWCPVVICDQCHKPIEKQGCVLFLPHEPTTLFTHKGYCSRKIERDSGFDEHLLWDELDDVLHQLLVNLADVPRGARPLTDLPKDWPFHAH